MFSVKKQRLRRGKIASYKVISGNGEQGTEKNNPLSSRTKVVQTNQEENQAGNEEELPNH